MVTGQLPASGDANGWLYKINTAQHPGPYNAFPGKCARCDADWRRGKFAPIGIHATGVQKVNQVLADGILRLMPDDAHRKLVVFTDSRQDAAKLAAGIELDHYRDLIRQALMQGFTTLGGDVAVVLRYFDAGPQSLSPLDRDIFVNARAQFRNEIEALEKIRDQWASADDQRIAAHFRARVRGPYPLTAVGQDVWSSLLHIGCNPAGSQPSRQERATTSWKHLIDWHHLPPRADLPPWK